MAMFKWDGVQLLRFLDFYQHHECLWNPRVESYNNQQARDEAFDSILRCLNLPGVTRNDIKAKIKSIRTIYKRELNGVTSQKMRDGSSYVPKLFWFRKADKFLREISLMRKPNKYNRSNRCRAQTNSENSSDPMFQSTDESANTDCQGENQKRTRVSCDEMNDDQTVQNSNASKFCVDCAMAPNHPPQAQSTSLQAQEDEYVQFCRGVAAQLSAIPDAYSRSVTKLKIQHILFEAENGRYKKKVGKKNKKNKKIYSPGKIEKIDA